MELVWRRGRSSLRTGLTLSCIFVVNKSPKKTKTDSELFCLENTLPPPIVVCLSQPLNHRLLLNTQIFKNGSRYCCFFLFFWRALSYPATAGHCSCFTKCCSNTSRRFVEWDRMVGIYTALSEFELQPASALCVAWIGSSRLRKWMDGHCRCQQLIVSRCY